MKMIKRLVCTVLSTIMCVSLCIPVFAAENKKNFLEERGFPTDFLERRTASQIDELYEACVEENLKFDSTKVVTLEEQLEENGGMPIGSIPENDMSLEVTPLVKIYNNQEVELVRVFVFYKWKKGGPWILKEDPISVNWDSTLFAYDRNFKLSCCSDDNEYYHKNRPDKSAQGGVGVFAKLYASAGVLSGTCRFDLIPKTTPLYLASKNTTGRIAHNVNVEYVHDKNLTSGALTLVVKGAQVSINVGGSYDEAVASSTAYFLKK